MNTRKETKISIRGQETLCKEYEETLETTKKEPTSATLRPRLDPPGELVQAVGLADYLEQTVARVFEWIEQLQSARPGAGVLSMGDLSLGEVGWMASQLPGTTGVGQQPYCFQR